MEKELHNILTALTASINSLSRSSGLQSNPASSPNRRFSALSVNDEVILEENERRLRLSAKNLTVQNRLMSNASKVMRNLIKVAGQEVDTVGPGRRDKDLAEAKKKLTETLYTAEETQSKLIIEYTKLMRLGIPQQLSAFKHLVDSTTGLANNFSTVQRNSGLMNAALIARANEISSDRSSLDYARYISDLKESSNDSYANKMTKGIMTKMHMIEPETGEINNNLSADEYGQFRLRLGEAGTAVGGAFADISEKLGKSVEDIFRQGLLETFGPLNVNPDSEDAQNMRAAMLTAAAQLQRLGADLPPEINKMIDDVNEGKNSETVTEDIKNLSKVLDDFYQTTKATMSKMDKLGVEVNTSLGAMKRKFSKEGIEQAASERLSELATLGGTVVALKKTADALLAIMTEASGFNVAHIASTFLDVQRQSVAMGMSFEDASKFMQDNKRVMGIYGADSFDSLRSGFEDAFNDFGYSFKQAADVVAPALEAAISSGVNVRDSNALNDYMRQTMQSFSKLAGFINISASQYAALNSELHGSEDVMRNMLGMTAEQSTAYARSLELQRDEMATRGISLQQAQEIIKAQESAKRAKVRERFEGGAKLMAQMGLLGFSAEEQMRAFNLTIKGRKTDSPEDKEYRQLMERVVSRREQYITEANGTPQMLSREAALEATMPTSAIEGVITPQAGLSVAERAKSYMLKGEQQRTEEASAPSQTIMHATEIRETAVSIATNSLVAFASAAAGALIAVSMAAGKASFALNMLSGGGSLLRGVGGAVGRFAMPTAALALGAGGVAGMFMNGYDAKNDSAFGHILSQALTTGASFGASGAMMGGLHGAMIGGGVGTAIGIGKGAYDVFTSPKTNTALYNPEQAVSDSINSSKSESGILQVSDIGAHTQLAKINEVLNEAVRLLALIAPQNQPQFKRSAPTYGEVPQAVDAIRR